MCKKRCKVAFVCVHNSCRSQMAEAIAKILVSDIFDVYSAGTDIKEQINTQAVEAIKILYSVDISVSQSVKKLTDIPKVDIVITMGCNIGCPIVPCRYREDWGLEDPTGKGQEAFLQTAALIKEKILLLKARLLNKGISALQ